MSKVRKCPMCDGKTKVDLQEFKSGKIDPRTNKEIVVKDIKAYSCEDSDCWFTWLPNDEEKRIEQTVATRSRFDLSKDDICRLRESLGFDTKFRASKFLCLNDKAFTKWELGYSEPNRAYDLLLRLAAFSKDNVNFIKKLHDKSFKFDPEDYELIRGPICQYHRNLRPTDERGGSRGSYKTYDVKNNELLEGDDKWSSKAA